MGFFDRFKRKKEITPAMLREMMEKLRADMKIGLAIENATERKDAIKALDLRIDEISVIVDDTLAQVEKNIKELSGSTWWAVRDAVNTDLRGLSRGKETLIATKAELAKMKTDLGAPASAKEEPATEPGE